MVMKYFKWNYRLITMLLALVWTMAAFSIQRVLEKRRLKGKHIFNGKPFSVAIIVLIFTTSGRILSQ